MSRISLNQTVPDDLGGSRLDQAVAVMFPDYSRSRLKAWILDGMLLLDGETVRPRDKVLGGEIVTIEAEVAAETGVAAQAVAFDISHADDAFLIVNKPAGLVVHPGAGNPDLTLQNGLIFRFPELAELPRAGILHRLDKDTSGLLLVARTLPASTELTRRLAQREIRREYLAVCNGVLTAGGKINAPISRHPSQRTRMAVHSAGRPAVTHYRVVQRYVAHTLIRVRLETGRTHQIRVHMAHNRHALVGDPVYGTRLKMPPGADEAVTAALRGFKRQALHATRLAFEHPLTAETVDVEVQPPADFLALQSALASHAALNG